ncbi:MAG: glycosyltransferase family 61 protein [Bacteroidota bacterium]
MNILFPESVSKRKAPVNIIADDLKLFSHEYEKKIHATTFTELKNAYVLNNTIFKLSTLKLYNQYSLVHPLRKKDIIKNLLRLSRKQQYVDSAIWITDEYADGYFHWLTDCLTRLIAAKPFVKSEVILLPVHLKKWAFIEQSLAYFKLKPLFFDTAFPVKVNRLLLPSHTAPAGNYNTSIINLLREQFVGSHSIKPSRNIYISRQKALKRKISNEQQVISLLKTYHFEIHYFENYDFSEQVNLMKDTKCLISLHGAGLTNMLFMREGTCVMELRNEEDAHNNCYFSLASDLAINYYYQLNKGDSKDTHEVNITVDTALLEKNIKHMLG